MKYQPGHFINLRKDRVGYLIHKEISEGEAYQ